MIDINERVSHKIRSLREKNGFTQESLAMKAELHRAYIGQIERCEKKIGLTNLEKIADALDVSIKRFFD